jgi:hypothetical protein
MSSAARQVADSVRRNQHRARRGDRQCAGSFYLWDTQDPSVDLSGFDLAVRLGAFRAGGCRCEGDVTCADGFDRAFGGWARQLGVGREVGAHADAEDREIGDPEPVGLYAVVPIAAGGATASGRPS